MTSEGYNTEYGSKFFVFKGDKLLDVTFSTESLKVPEMRPIVEKILQSFQFTTRQPQALNIPESTNSEPEESDSTPETPRFPTSMADNDEGNEDDRSTDEDDNNDSDEDEEN
jgi:hypothetical protein